MSKWKKGMKSPNPAGRPRLSKNKSTPHYKLQKALQNGWDMKDLKRFAKELISDPETKMSPAQVAQILKTLFDVELKLIEMDFKHSAVDVESPASSKKEEDSEEGDGDNIVEFSLRAK